MRRTIAATHAFLTLAGAPSVQAGGQHGVTVFSRQDGRAIELEAEGEIEAPPSKVRDVVLDYPSQPRYVRTVAESRILSRSACACSIVTIARRRRLFYDATPTGHDPRSTAPAIHFRPAVDVPSSGERWVHLQFRRFAGCPKVDFGPDAQAQSPTAESLKIRELKPYSAE